MNENKKPRVTFRTVLTVILVIILAVSGVGFLRERLESRRQRELEESLAELARQTTEAVTEPLATTEPETTEAVTEPAYVSPIDFAALREQNPDTVGWIRIPDTRIDYPIVQADDNEKYLHTDFDGKESVYGAVYLDSDSKPDFSGWNNPIYGHHMRDGSMFKDVVKFKGQEYFKAHQYFEVYTPERTVHLKAVACYFSDSSGIVRKTKFASQESFDTWVDERLAPCGFADPPEVPVDSMFVLVTCSYETDDARTLLFAVEVDESGRVIPAKTGQGKP